MPGAQFVRADLHVHTMPDGPIVQLPPVADFIAAAVASHVRVLGITDHHRIDRAKEAVDLGAASDILILPGIEVTTHEGHVLALFDPEQIAELEAFATQGILALEDNPRHGGKRSRRSLLEIVHEIGERGGLAIPAHIDTSDGFMARISSTALSSLLSSPALAALEFSRVETLLTWFGVQDNEPARQAAWRARQDVPELRDRGLARVMSSDAHTSDKVGLDAATRTLTRLRLDDVNFTAVRNALVYNSRARCKAEQTLPPSYPRLLAARFEGGFLDGVELDFASNFNCLIGGRGSGKSTALLALRAALGTSLEAAEGDDPDDPVRMPRRTEVDFVDAVGTIRTAVREVGGSPHEKDGEAPIALRLQGLGQDESGRLSRGYQSDPAAILQFLEQFVDVRDFQQKDRSLLAAIADNGADVSRTVVTSSQMASADKRVREVEAQLKAAQASRLDEIAKWATWLAAEGPLLTRLEDGITGAQVGRAGAAIDLDRIARDCGVDIEDSRAAKFVAGSDGLLHALTLFEQERHAAGTEWSQRLARAVETVRVTLSRWQTEHADLRKRLEAKKKELDDQGLTIQAGAVTRMGRDLERLRRELAVLQERHKEHQQALKAREQLLDDLDANRDSRFQARKAVLRGVVDNANHAADGLRIHLIHARCGIRTSWEDWLGKVFKFRTPRVERVARALSPRHMASYLAKGGLGLSSVTGDDGEVFFDVDVINEVVPLTQTWEGLFALQTMHLRDHVRIEVQEAGTSAKREFGHLSAGQQRSVLLSLMLCADRNDPLVLDQPEDHLDAQYIATSLVGHIEAAKERRQVVLATHSANLTVLGDAELVLPMYADAGHGAPRDPGSVDRPETRDHVCALLEGGENAFRRRGERYGLRFRSE